MAEAAIPLSLAATGLSAGSKVMAGNTQASAYRTQGLNDLIQGQQTNAADQFKAGNLDIEATYGEAKASETDAFMRDQLSSTLANITAVRASANVQGDSPTGAAIENRVEEQSDTARQQRLANINAQIASDRSAAAMERSAGLTALGLGQMNAATAEKNASAAHTSGLLGGFSSILSGLSGLTKLGGGGGATDALGTGTSGLT